MKRNDWTFDITAKELAAAAASKADHHRARFEVWKGKQEEVMAEVRAKGLTVETSVLGDNYGSNVRQYGPQIVIDEIYQRRLNECASKVQEHKKKIEEYDGWVQVLTANAGRTYPLNADDYLFFFGK